jgi:pyridoxine 5-phosphate synthase
MERVRLHVNVDHVATLRQARGTRYPDPVGAAHLCELAGADGITAHLREDRRHMGDRDLRLLRQTVRTVLNLEMAATEEMIAFALDVHPDLCTLVPEKREERTTEGGLALLDSSCRRGVEAAPRRLREGGIAVSLFIDPDRELVDVAQEVGASIVELHTGYYCDQRGDARTVELARLNRAAVRATGHKLRVAAGHGLDYPNVEAVAAIPAVEELNIGHSIVARAVMVGLDRAVRDMLELLRIAAYS